MKLVNFVGPTGQVRKLGLMIDGRVVDTSHMSRFSPGERIAADSVDDVIRSGKEAWTTLSRLAEKVRSRFQETDPLGGPESGIHELSAVTVLPAVLRPGKIIGTGWNYIDPRRSVERTEKAPPVGFIKASSALLGDGQPIRIPYAGARVAYESELALVIGKPTDAISEDVALDHLAGFTVANDLTAMDVAVPEQQRGGQVVIGKNFRTFCPLGPNLTTVDELADPMRLRVWSRVNRQIRQDSLTTAMLLDIRQLVAWWSRIGLDPGDVILTGTPPPISGLDEDWRYLAPGDDVECGVDGIGVITNRAVTERGSEWRGPLAA